MSAIFGAADVTPITHFRPNHCTMCQEIMDYTVPRKFVHITQIVLSSQREDLRES